MKTKTTSRIIQFWLIACLSPLVLLASQRVIPQDTSEGQFIKVTNHEEDLAYLLNQEAIELGRKGQYGEAIKKARRALELSRKVFGQNHRNIAADLITLSSFYQQKGDYFNAEPMIREAIEIDTIWFGADHPEVGFDMIVLGQVLWKQGDTKAGEKELREGIRMLAKGDPEMFAQASEVLGGLYKNDRQYSKALQHYLDAVQVYELNNKPQAVQVLVKMADMERSRGKYQSAEKFMQHARRLSQN